MRLAARIWPTGAAEHLEKLIEWGQPAEPHATPCARLVSHERIASSETGRREKGLATCARIFPPPSPVNVQHRSKSRPAGGQSAAVNIRKILQISQPFRQKP